MLFGVNVVTKVSYNVEVEAESFDQAEVKALEYVKNDEGVHIKICEAAGALVPDRLLADTGVSVDLICRG